jgi:hypothetical protein
VAAFAELDRIGRARDTNPFGYTEKDVERLVGEMRKQLQSERKLKRLKAAKK